MTSQKLKGFSNFSGADEAVLPHPPEYDMIYFAQILDSASPSYDELQKAIDKSQYYLNEFNRQYLVHKSNFTSTDIPTRNNAVSAAKTVSTWINTAYTTNQALKAKKTALFGSAVPASSVLTTSPVTTPYSDPTPTDVGLPTSTPFNKNLIFIGLGAVALVVTIILIRR